MEVGLGEMKIKVREIVAGLNPCCSGSKSRRNARKKHYRGIHGILILVIVEVRLRAYNNVLNYFDLQLS